jgi:hypothetical protein
MAGSISAVTHDFDCRAQTECVVNTAFALKRSHRGPRCWASGTPIRTFHEPDRIVDGRRPRRTGEPPHPCYTAFYSSHDGDIYRWNLDALDGVGRHGVANVDWQLSRARRAP